MTSPLLGGLIGDLDSLLGPMPVIPNLLGSSCTAPSSPLSLIDSASSSTVGTPSGSATASAQALGNPLIAESANSDVHLSASISLSAPASSVEVTIPYTTSGVTGASPNAQDTAEGLVFVGPSASPIVCADGTQGTASPFNQSGAVVLFPIGTGASPGSGTFTNIIRFYCPDGSDLVSGLGFIVTVADQVLSQSGLNETASANLQMHGVTATAES
jgi:hypothetical protein